MREQATPVMVEPNVASRLMQLAGFSQSPLHKPSETGPLWTHDDRPGEIFTYFEGLHIALRTIAEKG